MKRYSLVLFVVYTLCLFYWICYFSHTPANNNLDVSIFVANINTWPYKIDSREKDKITIKVTNISNRPLYNVELLAILDLEETDLFAEISHIKYGLSTNTKYINRLDIGESLELITTKYVYDRNEVRMTYKDFMTNYKVNNTKYLLICVCICFYLYLISLLIISWLKLKNIKLGISYKNMISVLSLVFILFIFLLSEMSLDKSVINRFSLKEEDSGVKVQIGYTLEDSEILAQDINYLRLFKDTDFDGKTDLYELLISKTNLYAMFDNINETSLYKFENKE